MVFAVMNEFQQSALIQRLAFQPCAFRQVLQILLEIAESGTTDAANHAWEAQVADVTM